MGFVHCAKNLAEGAMGFYTADPFVHCASVFVLCELIGLSHHFGNSFLTINKGTHLDISLSCWFSRTVTLITFVLSKSVFVHCALGFQANRKWKQARGLKPVQASPLFLMVWPPLQHTECQGNGSSQQHQLTKVKKGSIPAFFWIWKALRV